MVIKQSPNPYQDVFADLVASVMRAQADIIQNLTTCRLVDIPDDIINRHFVWLNFVYSEGENSHLFDSIGSALSIRTQALRHRRKEIPKEIITILRNRKPIESSVNLGYNDRGILLRLVQEGPTRISRLIKASLIKSPLVEGTNEHFATDSISIKSPLSVVYDYLTIPTNPASRSYALMTLRNYLFESFDVFPVLEPLPVGEKPPLISCIFTVQDVELELSFIWTSVKTRYQSRGRDPMPAEGRTGVGGMLRHFLASNNVLNLRFKTFDECVAFLARAELRGRNNEYAFVRSDQLDDNRLPELGHIENELWGLPIPLRGADTLFRGGVKFSSEHGLVIGIHGKPGTGKTSLALAIGAVVSPFGIQTLFLTGEESRDDLNAKAENLVPDDFKRLSFFPKVHGEWLKTARFNFDDLSVGLGDPLEGLENALKDLARELNKAPSQYDPPLTPAKPCRAVIVLDGIHDLIAAIDDSEQTESINKTMRQRLRGLIGTCRKLKALVLVTAGEDWAGERSLDYFVDVVVRLTHEGVGEYGRKPERRVTLVKARHQLSAIGTHGFQNAGTKGLRFSPQISYQLEQKSLWRTRLPEMNSRSFVMSTALSHHQFLELQKRDLKRGRTPELPFRSSPFGVILYRGSNIFINGEGSGGKAALALKIAFAPVFNENGHLVNHQEKILIVSFLYPATYYENIQAILLKQRRAEYQSQVASLGIQPESLGSAFMKVIHLYTGNYLPDQLFNRIEWELSAADLCGEPYTSIVIDGLHNVFLQFPEIEKYKLLLPQLYSALRTRAITIISTHTTFVLEGSFDSRWHRLDDQRSEPLRHALVQKTDFRFEIDPVEWSGNNYVRAVRSDIFRVRTVAAINQPLPKEELYWSREKLLFFETGQGSLGL